jgi:hypothetical protein
VLPDHLLGQGLGRPQDGGRVGGLVGRDGHETLHSGLDRGDEHVLGALDVGLHALARVLLEHRQVLECGRVEDDVGLVVAHDLPHPLRIADVRDHGIVSLEEGLPPELELKAVQVGLVVVEHDEAARGEAVDLTAQLTADRASCSGDEHRSAGDDLGDLRRGDVHLTSPDQVGHVERAQVSPDDVALQHGDEGRQPADAGPDACSGGGQPGHLGLGKTGDGEDHDVDALGRRHLEDVREPAEHGQVPNPSLGHVVVEESHRTQSEVRDALQVSSQRLAGRARSHDQGP